MFNKLLTDTLDAKKIRNMPLENAAGTVMLKLMFCANRHNIIKGSPAELVSRLGITLWDFNHGIRILKKRDLVRKYTKQEYMITPHLLINGDDKQRYIINHMWETQTLGSAKNASL
jgi:hypothetical protein